MLLTPHTLVGITLATAIPNPSVAIPVSFLMHFAGDLIPHWDLTEDLKRDATRGWVPLAIFADLMLGVAFGITFTLYALWVLKNPMLAINIFGCGIASVLPDALSAPAIYGNKPNFITTTVMKIQIKLQSKAGPIWGSLSQIFVMAVCFLAIANSLSQ